MYSTKQLSVVDKKQRVKNKRHTKSTYNERLAKPTNNTNIRLQSAQSENIEDKEKLKSQVGRKSFGEIAVEKGVFNDITTAIEDFVMNNPYFSQSELMKFLVSEFNDVFGKSKTKYPQTFYKSVEHVDEWYNALLLANKPTNRAIMRSLYKDMVNGDATHKDMMDFVQLMNKVELNNELNKIQVEYAKNRNKLIEAQIDKLNNNSENSDTPIVNIEW